MAEVNKRQGNIDEYVITCPHCGRELVGWSESQVRYNLKIHIDSKHREKTQLVTDVE